MSVRRRGRDNIDTSPFPTVYIYTRIHVPPHPIPSSRRSAGNRPCSTLCDQRAPSPSCEIAWAQRRPRRALALPTSCPTASPIAVAESAATRGRLGLSFECTRTSVPSVEGYRRGCPCAQDLVLATDASTRVGELVVERPPLKSGLLCLALRGYPSARSGLQGGSLCACYTLRVRRDKEGGSGAGCRGASMTGWRRLQIARSRVAAQWRRIGSCAPAVFPLFVGV